MKDITLQTGASIILNKIFRHLESSVITFCGLRILQSVSRVSDLEETILSEEMWTIFSLFS